MSKDNDVLDLEDLDLEGLDEDLEIDLSEIDTEDEPEEDLSLDDAQEELEVEDTPKDTKRAPKSTTRKKARRGKKTEEPADPQVMDAPSAVVGHVSAEVLQHVIQHRMEQIQSGALDVPGGEKAKQAAVGQLRWTLSLLSLLQS